MAERIYTRDRQGRLEPLEEEPFALEDELQALIAEHPELLDGEQMRPGDPRRWILITREQGIAETADSPFRWALDHLIIDQDATPTLVEVKRGSNPEVRRTIVGQMLDYAAHAPETWKVDELRRTFENAATESGTDPEEELAKLLQADGTPDVDGFWEKVSTNLDARRIRLLFVADKIPDELARVVEFLNEQMQNIEVLAVEVKQFRGESMQTLVPRVIGRIATTSSRSTTGRGPSLTRDKFLYDFAIPDQRNAAARLLSVAEESGATFEWGPSGVSVRVRCKLWPQPITLAWLYPPTKVGRGWMKTRDFTFGAAIFDYEPPPEEDLRSVLELWVGQFSGDDFTQDASSKGVSAYAVGYEAAVQNIDLLSDRLVAVIEALRSL